MAEFLLYNNAEIAGTIVDTPKEKDFPLPSGKLLSIKPRLATSDDERARQVYGDVAVPYNFRSKSRTAFDTGGHLLLKGKLQSWIPEPTGSYEPRAFLSIKTHAANGKDITAEPCLTSAVPIYENRVKFAGVRVDSPLTEGEKFDTPDKTDGEIYYFANNEKKNGKRNIIPVLMEDVPADLLDAENKTTVWLIEGRFDSVTLGENHWTDVIRPKNAESVTPIGEFKDVVGCMVECSGPAASADGDDDTETDAPSDDDVPF